MSAPYQTLRACELVEQTAPLRWLVDGLFIESGCGILGGAPKNGKSFFALELCVAIASGTPCASRFKVEQSGPVVILCAEDPNAVISARLDALVHARGLQLSALPLDIIVEPFVRLPDGLHRLAATLAAKKPRLLLLDPLIRLHRADENSASEMSVILDGLRNLARTSGCAVLLVHHARKATSSSGGTGLRGSSDMHAFGDSNLYLRKLPQDRLLELRVEHRAAAASDPLRLTLEVDDPMTTARFNVLSSSSPVNQSDDSLATRVLALITGAKDPLSVAALRNQLGVRNQAVTQAIRTLESAGKIHRRGRDGWTQTESA